CHRQGLVAVPCGHDLEPGEAQTRRQQLEDVRLVVDDEQPRLRALLTRRPSPAHRRHLRAHHRHDNTIGWGAEGFLGVSCKIAMNGDQVPWRHMPAQTRPARRERPIFVLGCPRSGTTLLQMMLHAHPRIAIPPETKFVMGAYRRRQSFGDLRKAKNREKVARWIINRPTGMFGDMQLDPALVIERVTAAPPTFGSLIAAIFKAYAEKHGRPRWGDKRPYYYQDVPALHRMFPDAQFVHIV